MATADKAAYAVLGLHGYSDCCVLGPRRVLDAGDARGLREGTGCVQNLIL